MKLKLLTIALLASVCFSNAQEKSNFWKSATLKSTSALLESKKEIPQSKLFELDVNGIQSVLSTAPNRFAQTKNGKVISLPNGEGIMERFSVYENSILAPELAANYPNIKSYIGIGIDNPTSTVYFSISPLGFQSMQLNGGKPAVFIEPLTQDLLTYSVFKKADKVKQFSPFECGVIDAVADQIDPSTLRPNADDSTLRTFRLAVSTTGEYTAYFGGTKAQALAAINATMTRVNGVFEKDFAVRMVLIANTDLVIYTNASTDPYTTSYNSQVQSTLTSVIGEANYDIGHLFVRASNNGNAGCIGCVCVNGSKGSAFTAATVPTGDLFDIDYVAHEMGHQFGANHTFSFSNEGTGANMEPGSGSTIMGYAGITGQDVQPNSDAYFHAFSIQQVTNNVKGKTCQTNTATGNAVPTANAGLDYTIPRSTPFMLTGSGTDANGDALTYIWEQFDNAASNATGASSAASATRTSGPTFRSYSPSTSPVRYFPRMQSILAGATTTTGTEITVEALPSVARTMNFRLTVRDNRAGGSANNSDDMIVTVNGTAGPFTVTSPNTAVSYPAGSTQTVTWNVAGTTANGVNCANVDILISTDGGNTWSNLVTATPNDGSQAITIPNTQGNQNRIMVKGNNHIFFDVSNANFTITAGSSDTVAPTAPTLAAAGTTSTSTNLSWSGATDNVGVTGYDVYRGGVLIGSTTTATTFAVTGLTPSTTYAFNVRAKDAAGNISVNSNTVSVTTLAAGLTYCTSQGNSIVDEYIGRVQIGTIDNSSGGVTGYVDYTSLSTDLTKGSSATITITPTWTGTTYSEGYAVFIDYNQNGLFTDTGETVWSLAPTTATPVSGTFTIPTTAANGPTRMRVSMKYNGTPTACETFSYGQVEDYTVNLVVGTTDTTAPSAPTNLIASGTTQTTTNLSWNASTDNVGVTGYDVYSGTTLLGTVATTTAGITGLTASTTYTFSVRAKDAAGNISSSSNTVNVTTLAAAGNGTDLLFSEYVEGTSNNKALEIANYTGSAVNLSGYSIRKQTNGSGSWGTALNLSGTINNGAKFVIVHSSISAACYNRANANISTSVTAMTFNGNDPVGLFKNGVLIDIIGTFNGGSSNFAANTTLRRKASILSPSTTFNRTADWDSFSSNTCNGIGNRLDESDDEEGSDFVLYPNPIKGDILNIANLEGESTYVIYNMMGQELGKGKIENESIYVGSLATGTYLIQISNETGSKTKPFIKQ
ncbi:T9SS type A sorting domain-containing protein [Flavobacterium piscinae]|uniref:T9SS type A sorting domain-containing protein n=1 Tax=Flavobacterium piscinae TaxID=2506424 RepID=A0A4Q1KY87_9FLAO|nr:zinc-dependent metalloprotease family protein [Flavobacterium piscinae]RXR35333.1 T9SS type A sorting domain-containing protein [Flavobacterium piscinae]